MQVMQLLAQKQDGGQDISKILNLQGNDQDSVFGSGGFGFNKGTMNGIGQGIQGLGGLASIYFGSKQLGLAEDQYNTNKEFGNRNIANQATTINNSIEARYRAAQAAKGGKGMESVDSYLNRSKVDGSAIN